MSKFNAKVNYVSAAESGRDYRFVYNCVADKYFYSQDSNFMVDLRMIVDSLRYLELDQHCGQPISLSDIKILNNLEDFNLEIDIHTERMYNENYQKPYILDMENNPRTTKSIIDSVKSSISYDHLRYAEVYGYKNVDEMIQELINLLIDTSYVGLSNSRDLIYWERINSGDLEYYGHGGVVFDDIFTVSGRANHILYKITGTQLGNVRINPDVKYLNRLKCRWESYVKLLN